jgi:hypothetical protein
MDVSDLQPGSHSVNLSFKETPENLELLDAQVDIVISRKASGSTNDSTATMAPGAGTDDQGSSTSENSNSGSENTSEDSDDEENE